MDKKRRKKNTSTIPTEKVNLYDITTHISSKEKCGLISNVHSFYPEYGNGTYQIYAYEGLYVAIFDVTLKKDFIIEGALTDAILELSFLIEGEQIVHVKGIEQDFTYENQESYLVYLPKVKGAVHYSKEHPLKEVKIRMGPSFIKKHQLEDELKYYNIHNLVNQNFTQPINNSKQEILCKLFNNKQEGLTKRLLLESLTLQLLSLQLSNFKDQAKPDNLVKKLYEVQTIISSDLANHHSIQDLSKQIGLNDFLLKREFKRVFGKTVFEYLTELRMEKSKELLSLTDKPIYEISEMIGYKNATHFTAAFKRNENMTPKKYRVLKLS